MKYENTTNLTTGPSQDNHGLKESFQKQDYNFKKSKNREL